MTTAVNPKTLNSIAAALEKTRTTDARIREIVAQNPAVRPRQISAKAHIWPPRLLERMGLDSETPAETETRGRAASNPLDSTVEAETEIIKLIEQERETWDEARDAAGKELDRHKRAVANAEQAREDADVKLTAGLAALVDTHPDFNRTQLAKACGIHRSVIFTKLAAIKSGDADVDADALNGEEVTEDTVKRLFAEIAKARVAVTKTRQDRKDVLRQIDDAAERKLSVPYLAESAGLHRTWTLRYLGPRSEHGTVSEAA